MSPEQGKERGSLLAEVYGGWLQQQAADMPAAVRAAIERLFAAVGDGHVCIELDENTEGWTDTAWVGGPGDYKPFIFDHARLYLARYWSHEQTVAASLRARAGQFFQVTDVAALHAELDALFPKRDPADRQRLAALVAQYKPLTLISGGPGTGKTSTVVNILALLLGRNPQLRIGLSAPTGKAAQRLVEAITTTAQNYLAAPDAIKQLIPTTATTLHRLLGALGDTGRFRHDRDNPLPLDVLVIDEASMIDLALIRTVLDALPLNARLILLGDKDQLASVEAGSVFGDISAAQGMSEVLINTLAPYGVAEVAQVPAPLLGDCRVELTYSYRFGADSGIGTLASAARVGDAAAFMASFTPGRNDIAWGQQAALGDEAFQRRIAAGYGHYLALARRGETATAFAAFQGLRVLCAHRQGPAGVEGLNRAIEALLGIAQASLWYAGRPVMITANDYTLRLFNGDIGLCLPTPAGLRVFFEGEGGVYRMLLPARVPRHETAWAMTVHKAQGSEFDEVLFVMPDQLTPVLNRPLVYTAVTRAKKRFALWGMAVVIQTALLTLPQRDSGLQERLR
jgi:exodeoxyribonuclease V alpha subunit